MSSPTSASSNAAKRKRTTASTSAAPADMMQPQSHDASGEAMITSSTPVVNGGKHNKTLSTSDASDPPAKRLRSSTHGKANGTEEDVGASQGEDVEMIKDDNTTSMAPPPTGTLVDPVGYKTNPPPVGRAVRVYADGVFDLFHLGHMRQLEQAKKAFPDVYLMVGVTGDKETHKRKGLTVLSGQERAETVRHCKWVDEVIEDCPWILTTEFMDQNKIDYVAHDDLPYGADEGDDIYKPIKEAGKFLVTQRTEGVSTTGIITKIVRDYEKYIARQFKRGTSRQELNVSWLKKNELDLKRHVSEIRDSIRNNWTSTGQELGKELQKFWQQSRPGSPGPGRLSMHEEDRRGNSLSSPSALSHISSRLNIPGTGGPSNDFAAGYSLGLIGGVRSWMTKNRQTDRDSSHQASDDSDEDSDGRKSPIHEKKNADDPSEQLVDEQIASIMAEDSKKSGR